jgi:hypothetical protein
MATCKYNLLARKNTSIVQTVEPAKKQRGPLGNNRLNKGNRVGRFPDALIGPSTTKISFGWMGLIHAWKQLWLDQTVITGGIRKCTERTAPIFDVVNPSILQWTAHIHHLAKRQMNGRCQPVKILS